MKNIDQEFNKIQDYIDGSLSKSDMEAFRKRMAKEPALKRLYERSKAAINVVQQESERSTMALLKNIEQSEELTLQADLTEKRNPKLKIKPLWYIAIAAVFTGLILVSMWLFQPKNQNMVAFNEYYETPSYDTQRGASNTDELFTEAMVEYQNGDFNAALQKLKDYEDANDITFESQIYRAVSNLELNRTIPAIEILDGLIQGDQQLDQVYWLKALAHLKLDQTDEAIFVLKVLLSEEVSATPNRKQKAQELLDKLQID